MYKGIKCCEQQLRRVDKALSRPGDIAVGSWICLSHRNLILAEDKRLCGERLYALFNEVGTMSVTEYKSGTNWCNKCSILADKEFAFHLMFTPRKQKKKKCHQKIRKSTLNKIMFSAILIHCLLLNIIII